MRRLSIHIGVALLFAGAALGQGQDEARAILDKGIKAHGGEEMLRKFKAGTVKNKGRLEILNGVDIMQEISFCHPDKFREEMSFDANGMAIKVVTVFNGGKGAVEVNGKKLPSDDKLLEQLKEGAQLLEVFKLYPLKSKDYELASIGEAQVNGKPAVGIRVSRKGQRDVSVYFDKETGLIAKTEHRTVDFMSGEEVSQERIITEYQKIEGQPQPRKVLVNRDGKKFLEAEVLEYKSFETLDDGMFTVP